MIIDENDLIEPIENLSITATYSNIFSEFITENNNASINGFDTRDSVVTTSPSNYTQLYSEVNDTVINQKLALDLWNVSHISRELDLVWFASPSITGLLNFTWIWNQSGLLAYFVDYGENSTRTSTPIANITLNHQVEYSLDVTANSTRYLTLEVVNA